MMAENTDINVKDEGRQSKDYHAEFSSASITEDSTFDDSSFKCWCHEVFIPNQRPERCSPGLDETPSDKSSEINSIYSFSSFDSGYGSITHIYSISKYDECNKQNPLWTSNKTSSTDISTDKVSMSTPVDTPNI